MAGILTLTVTMLDSRLTSLKKAGRDATAADKAAEMETRMTGQLSSQARLLFAAELAVLRQKEPLRTHGRGGSVAAAKRPRTSPSQQSGEGGGGAASVGAVGSAMEGAEEVVNATVGFGGSMWASAASAAAGVIGAAHGAFHAASYALSPTTNTR